MGKRLLIIALVLGVRLVVGGVVSRACLKGERVRLAGIVEKSDQTDSQSIIWLKDWAVEMPKNRIFLQNKMIKVVGRCERGVIDFFLSRNRSSNY